MTETERAAWTAFEQGIVEDAIAAISSWDGDVLDARIAASRLYHAAKETPDPYYGHRAMLDDWNRVALLTMELQLRRQEDIV